MLKDIGFNDMKVTFYLIIIKGEKIKIDKRRLRYNKNLCRWW